MYFYYIFLIFIIMFQGKINIYLFGNPPRHSGPPLRWRGIKHRSIIPLLGWELSKNKKNGRGRVRVNNYSTQIGARDVGCV